MQYQLGNQICWTNALDTDKDIQYGTVTKVAKCYGVDCIWVDNKHKPEDCIDTSYVWPISAKQELVAALIERRMLKKAFDDSLMLIFQLRNRVTRGEFK